MVIGSHHDLVKPEERGMILLDVESIVEDNSKTENFHGCFALDCRFSSSDHLNKLRQVLSTTCASIRRLSACQESDYSNRLCASLLYYLQNHEDCSEQVTITVRNLCSLIKQLKSPGPTLVQLTEMKLLLPVCDILSSNGHLLFLKSDQKLKESLLILNEKVILSCVHSSIKEIRSSVNNIGIVEELHLCRILSKSLKNMMESSLAIKYLIISQFCTKVAAEQLITKLSPYQDKITKQEQVYYFFPNLVQASKPANMWLAGGSPLYAYCMKCTEGCFYTPRFLHTLFIQLVEFGDDRDCFKYVIWKNGILLVHSNGSRFVIEVTDQTTQLQLVMQCVLGFELHLVQQRSSLISLIKSLRKKVCPCVETKEFLIHNQDLCPPESVLEIAMVDIAKCLVSSQPFVVSQRGNEIPQQTKLSDLLIFDCFYVLSEQLIRQIFTYQNSEQIVSTDTLDAVCKAVRDNSKLLESLQGNPQLTYSQLYSELHKYTIFPEGNLCALAKVDVLQMSASLLVSSDSPNFASYVSSLPPAVRPHLEYKLDKDSDVQRDLYKIAHHMLHWDLELATHLQLTEVDLHDIKYIHPKEPELQRREALRRWKNRLKHRATYGNLLQMFVDAGHRKCAEVLCEVLRKKYATEESITSSHCKPKTANTDVSVNSSSQPSESKSLNAETSSTS